LAKIIFIKWALGIESSYSIEVLKLSNEYTLLCGSGKQMKWFGQ